VARVFYLHWNREEALEHVRALRRAGHTVSCHYSTRQPPKIRSLPDACVISLARLPSHGRAVAEWFREAKARLAVPLIFVGGAEEKVAQTRRRFPDARYCAPAELTKVIARACSSGVARRRQAAPSRRIQL
jgi:hypothetical protein